MVYDSRPAFSPHDGAAQPGHGLTVGVLALQGAVAEHAVVLRSLGAAVALVRTPEDFARCDALVLPGGESTTMRKLLASAGLTEPIREGLAAGMPALGTCAGMIVLAASAPDGAPPGLGLLDVAVERNGFGRQPYSFEGPVELTPSQASEPQTVRGVFIRAPRITGIGDGVEVIGRLRAGRSAGEAVAVRHGSLVACTFHPELVGASALHRLLVSMAAARMQV